MIEGPLRLKVQIHCGDEPALGPGRAALLAAIDEHGSISAAGRVLGMSYRRSWMLVDSMNRCWTERLVETSIGGGKARGARLSATGRSVLDAYRELEEALAVVAKQQLGALTATLREAPLPAVGAEPP